MEQLPASTLDSEILARSDSAGASHDFAFALRECDIRYSVGYSITAGVREAILGLAETAWSPAINADGSAREGAWVCAFLCVSLAFDSLVWLWCSACRSWSCWSCFLGRFLLVLLVLVLGLGFPLVLLLVGRLVPGWCTRSGHGLHALADGRGRQQDGRRHYVVRGGGGSRRDGHADRTLGPRAPIERAAAFVALLVEPGRLTALRRLTSARSFGAVQAPA